MVVTILLQSLSANKSVLLSSKKTFCQDKPLTFVISAKTGEGIQGLKDALFQAEKDLVSNADSTFVTNVRHYEALQRASSALDDCRSALAHGIPSDLVAEDLRRALQEINAILGTDLLDPEIILHNIFSKHCIGK